MKHFLLIILFSISLIGCTVYHSGTVSTGGVENSSNISYEDIALGTATDSYFLGFGGYSKDALILEAKRNLFAARELKSGENYANFTVDYKYKFYPFIIYKTAIISADVVKKVDTKLENPFSENYKNKLFGNKTTSNSLFKTGDSVYIDLDGTFLKGIIISFVNNGNCIVSYLNKSGIYKNKRIPTQNIYSLKIEQNNGFKLNDTPSFYFSKNSVGLSVKTNGAILAFGLNSVLLLSGKQILSVDYTFLNSEDPNNSVNK